MDKSTDYSVSELKEILKNIQTEKLNKLLEAIKNDGRKSVQNLFNTYSKKIEKYKFELERVHKMYEAQRAVEKNYGSKISCCIDEVGRGPLAGPVAVCGTVLTDFQEILYVKDSKKNSPQIREFIYNEAISKNIIFSCKSVDNTYIDTYGINSAIDLAIKNIIEEIREKFLLNVDFCIYDGNRKIKNIGDLKQKLIVKADDKIYGVALASNIAKYVRDSYMIAQSEKYPEYQFDKNKGYGTKYHIEQIIKHGISPIHRKSYLKNFLLK